MRLRGGHSGSGVEGVPVCALHRRHSPERLTMEFHHLVPVAWQLSWQPPEPWPYPGRDQDGRGRLFDARGAELCPTGHRNVHYWIVRLMKALPEGSETPADAVAALRAQGVTGRTLEFQMAEMALLRWKEAGGSLQTLVAAKEWGES